MAILPSQKNPALIIDDFRKKITQRTNITNFDRDSKARSIADTLSEEVAILREETRSAFRANQTTTAEGQDLVEHGLSRGTEKLNSTFAFSNSTSNNFAFYVSTGTFGDINAAADIVIPAGTILTSNPNNNEQGAVVQYEVVTAATAPAASSIVYLDVKAKDLGANSNVGKGVIVNHTFTNYALSSSGGLQCINFYPVLNGRNADSDDLYRFKIAQKYSSLQRINEASLQLEGLGVPGVLDSNVLPGYFGIGTVAVVVLGAENQIDDSLIRMVNTKLQELHAPGLRMSAIPAVQVQFDLTLSVRTVRSLTVVEQAALENQIRIAVRTYFRQTGVGGLPDLNELGRRLRISVTASVILNSGANNIAGMFKEVFVRKGFNGGLTGERQQVLSSSYSLEEDEYPSLGTLTISYTS